MSAAAKFPLELIIKAVDRATGVLRSVHDRIEKLTDPIRRVNNAVHQLSSEAGFGRLHRQIGRVGASLSRVSNEAQRSATKMAVGFGVAGYAFNELLLKPAAEFEKQQAMMLTASGGDAAQAKKSMAWVRKFAMETPLELADTIDAFIRLKNWGIDPMNGSLRAMAEQTAAMGGDRDMLNGIILAFGQSFTAGKLQGQDIGQLTTRGVPVWDLLSKNLKKPIAEVRKLSEAGKIGRKEIEGLWAAMGARSSGAMERAQQTWAGVMSRLGDFKTIFPIEVMDAGAFDFLKGKLVGFLNLLQTMYDDGRLTKLAIQIGENLKLAFEAIWEFAPKVWDAMKTLYGVFAMFANSVGGVTNALIILGGTYVFGPLLISLSSLTVSMIALGAAMSGPLLAGLVLATRAIALFSGALLAIPGGWVIVALLGIAMVAHAIYEYWEPIRTWWAEFWTDFIARFESAWNDLGAFGKKIGDALFSALQYAFDLARGAVPQWFIDLTGGAFKLGSDLGAGLSNEIGSWFGQSAPVPLGPPVNASAAKPKSQFYKDPQLSGHVDVRVTIPNAPPGTRATARQSGFTEFRLDTGSAMWDAR